MYLDKDFASEIQDDIMHTDVFQLMTRWKLDMFFLECNMMALRDFLDDLFFSDSSEYLRSTSREHELNRLSVKLIPKRVNLLSDHTRHISLFFSFCLDLGEKCWCYLANESLRDEIIPCFRPRDLDNVSGFSFICDASQDLDLDFISHREKIIFCIV